MLCLRACFLLGAFLFVNAQLRAKRQEEGSGSILEPDSAETLQVEPVPVFDCTAEGVNMDGNNANPFEDFCSRYFFTCQPGQDDGSLQMCFNRHNEELVYDAKTDSCQYAANTESCGGNATTTVEPTTVPMDTTFNCSDLISGNYPDGEEPCSSTFYTCQEGIEFGFRRECSVPAGTVYDVVSDSCQMRQYTEACGGTATTTTEFTPTNGTTTEGSPSSTEAPAFVCESGASGNFANPAEDCSAVFYSCQPGQTEGIERRCVEPDTFYDVATDACQLPEHVPACGGNTTTTTEASPTDTTEAPIPGAFDCRELSVGNHPNPADNCSSLFFTCVGGRVFGILRFCDHGTVFDTEQNRCEYPEYVTACGGMATTASTTTNATTAESTTASSSTESTTSSASSNETTTGSDGSSTEETTQETTTEDSDAFMCSGKPFGNYPRTEGCSASFYSCPGPVHRDCPEDTFFDQELDQCLFYDQVPECSGTPRPNTTEATTTASTTTQAAAEGEFSCTLRFDGNYAAGECTEYFWQCSNGRRFKVPCASPSLRYSEEIDACVAAAMVPGCRMDNLMLDMDTERPCAGRANGFYPDPAGDCGKYAMCINFVRYSINCDVGLVYDTSINRCAIPERVSGACGFAPPATFSCAQETDGYHRSNMDCAVHYKCESGVLKAVKTCPLGYAFDTASAECMPVQQVDECQPDKDLSLGEQFCSVAGADGIYLNPLSCHSAVICLYDRLLAKHNAFTFVCSDPNEPDFYEDTVRCGPPKAGCTLPDETTASEGV